MSRSTAFRALLLLLALLLGACAAIEKSERKDSLESALKSYERAIRWGLFEDAWSYHKREGDKPRYPAEVLKNIKVTRYRIVATQPGPDDQSYRQTARIDYYLGDSPSVRQITQRQEWTYDAEAKRWWLTSEPPRF